MQAQQVPVCFVIVGDGSYKDTLASYVEENQLQDAFLFIPRQPAPQIPQLLAQADAGLVILKKSDIFSKTLPAKVQSYMACALPLIVSADGEASRVVMEADAGFVAPAEEAEALADAISQFAELNNESEKPWGHQQKQFRETFQKSNSLTD